MQYDDSIFILIVEDSAIFQVLYRSIFNRLIKTYNPKIYPLYATDGKGALEQFNAHDIKLVFMNYSLPGGMSGDEIAIAMRKHKDVPTIWRSALGSYAALPSVKPFAWAGEFTQYGSVTEEAVLNFLQVAGIEREII